MYCGLTRSLRPDVPIMVDWVLRIYDLSMYLFCELFLCVIYHLHHFSVHGSNCSIGKGLFIYSDCLAFCSLCTLTLYIIPQN